ncbi:MAG TPA: hypothetical protein ENI59_00620 [Euryarchaeota archaeon]|nr:hypothetical protein [Euryarchaeota archaeon]
MHFFIVFYEITLKEEQLETAMYGLIDLVKKGIIEKGSIVTFLHTGGTPIVFQKVEEIMKHF